MLGGSMLVIVRNKDCIRHLLSDAVAAMIFQGNNHAEGGLAEGRNDKDVHWLTGILRVRPDDGSSK